MRNLLQMPTLIGCNLLMIFLSCAAISEALDCSTIFIAPDKKFWNLFPHFLSTEIHPCVCIAANFEFYTRFLPSLKRIWSFFFTLTTPACSPYRKHPQLRREAKYSTGFYWTTMLIWKKQAFACFARNCTQSNAAIRCAPLRSDLFRAQLDGLHE